MRSLSIRGVDEQLATLLKAEAMASNKSVNQLVLENLRKLVGLDKKKMFTHKYHDLDDLFGKWSEDEFAEIQGTIGSERQIDQELWK